MKKSVSILLAGILVSCSTHDKKLFIKSLMLNEERRVDWYFHSLIGNFSRSYVQFAYEQGEKHIFFESFYLSDITKSSDTLIIEVFKNDYKIYKDQIASLGMAIRIDTTGGEWNEASSRLGRLQSKKVNVDHFHFEDSYCPKNECY